MTTTTKPSEDEYLQICESLEKHLGFAWYNRFLCSTEETRARGQLWFWQEEMLRRFQSATGIAIKSADELVCLLDVAIRKLISLPPPSLEAGYGGYLFDPSQSERPDYMSAKDWREFHMECALESDAAMRHARQLLEQALSVRTLAEAARGEGNESLADTKLREAFEFAKRAAEESSQSRDPECVDSEYHCDAARFALEIGQFSEAVRLINGMGQGDILGGVETLLKRTAEINQQKEEMYLQAEAVRELRVGKRLRETTLVGRTPAFSPDSQYLACAVGEKQVHVYEVISQRKIFEFEVDFKAELPQVSHNPRMIGSIAYSADATFMALGGNDGSVILWDCETKTTHLALDGHRFHTVSVTISPDGRRLASSGSWGVKLWDLETGRKLGSFAKYAHNGPVAFSPNGKHIAWAQELGRLNLLDAETKQQIYTLKPHFSDIADLSFSPCGKMLATACHDGTAKLFNADDGREIVTLHGASHSVAFSPDGKYLVTANMANLLVWELAKRRCIFAIPDTFWILSVRFSPDGKWLAASQYRPGIRLWSFDHLLSLGEDRSALREKEGTVSVPTNPRTAAELATKTAAAPAKMPAPAHLTACTAPVKSSCSSKRYMAHVQCPCGSKRFRLRHTAATFRNSQGDMCPGDTKVGEGYFLVIAAKCTECDAEHLLFDKDKHGWNGFLCSTESAERPRPELIDAMCAGCDNPVHSIVLSVFSEGLQDAIQESGDVLNESNYQEGFGSITMATTCRSCGRKTPDFLHYETM